MTEIMTRPPRIAAFAWGYNSSGGLGLGHADRAAMPGPRVPSLCQRALRLSPTLPLD
jgi:hypothetical protein